MIIQGDCIEQMKLLDENSVDAIVTDPPYGIGFMGKEWDNFKPREVKKTTKLVYKTDYINGVPVKRKKLELVTRDSGARVSGTYDLSLNGNHKFQLWFEQVAKECLRVLKPGGFLLSFGGTRTYHRMTCGIEDAGFEIRDTIMWLYGSGFPKSLNIGKQIDKMAGKKRKIIGVKKCLSHVERGDSNIEEQVWNPGDSTFTDSGINYETVPATKEAKEWEGWGTALKPACEPIVVARKPLSEKNVALNVLKHGTGGINIDACRIGTEEKIANHSRSSESSISKGIYGDSSKQETHQTKGQEQGRFPANIILDEEAGKLLDEQSGDLNPPWGKESESKNITSWFTGKTDSYGKNYQDKGGASRFFYCAKASKSERNFGCEDLEPKQRDERRKEGNPGGDNPRNRGVQLRTNNHPTVKPIKLMEYLIKLVSKKGAKVLDPFGGSGTTAIACIKLGRIPILIEKEEEYVKISKARIKPFLEQGKL